LVIWYTLDVNSYFPKKFLKFFLVSVIILILDAILQFNLGTNILGWEKFHPQRISSFFGDELVLGSYLVRFLPLIVGLYIFVYFNEFNFNKTLILFLIILIFYVGISVSGDRSAFYLSLLFLPFLINLKKISYLKDKLFIFGTSFLILLFVLVFTNDSIKKRVIDSTIGSMLVKSSEKNKNNKIILFSNNHENHIKTAIKIFNDNKFFGVGIKHFRFVCGDPKYFENKHSCSTHPHNIYIQILAELGLLGFIFIMIYFFYVCLKIFNNIFSKKNSAINLLNLMVLSSIFINLFPFSPSGNFFNNWISIIYFFPIGFYLYSIKKN
jgi:O-antigen ligase